MVGGWHTHTQLLVTIRKKIYNQLDACELLKRDGEAAERRPLVAAAKPTSAPPAYHTFEAPAP